MEEEKNKKTKFYIKLCILAVLILIFLGLIFKINSGTHIMARDNIYDILIFIYIVIHYIINCYWINIVLAIILLIYNIIKKNNIKLNICLMIYTVFISLIIELDIFGIILTKGDFIISSPVIKITFSIIILLIILGISSIKCKLKYSNHCKKIDKITKKYLIGITIIILLTIFNVIDIIIFAPGKGGYFEKFYKYEILEERLKFYLEILPQLILYIQIYIAFIASNLKKCEKKGEMVEK